MVREIITEWSGDGGMAGLTIMYFDEATPVAQQRSDLNTLWSDIKPRLHTSTRWDVRGEGRELSDSTGVLTGFWAESTPLNGTGSSTGQPLANATQALIRWNTGAIVAGRRVQGRTFVPGLATGASSGGELSAVVRGDFQTAIDTFLVGATGFGVWHRPKSGSGGSFHAAVSGTPWTEFATQRRRRG